MRRFRAALLVALCALAGCSRPVARPTAPAQPAATAPAAAVPAGPQTLNTADGAKLKAWFRPAAGPAHHALLLVPMLGCTHSDYEIEALALNAAGCATLALDLRGHGDSFAPGGLKLEKFTQAQWQAMRADVRAGVAALARLAPRVPVVVLGAGYGANLALAAAAEKPGGIAALALLSPRLEEHGLQADADLAKLKALPVLLAVGGDDAPSYSAAAKLQQVHPVALTTYLQFDGRAHGTQLFSGTDLRKQLLGWLKGLS